MKTKSRLGSSLVPFAAIVLVACGSSQKPASSENRPTLSKPCAVALAPHTGSDEIDSRIRALQQRARKTPDSPRALERLGWLFVSKARLTFDEGYYRLAEQTSACLESRRPDSLPALLLRGHVMHNLHRFKEAEAVARKLIAAREAPFDYGLLGDVLMEQGQLDEAADAYQRMIDLKPSLHSYSRAAHMRWLEGDLDGAIEIMRMAARASSPRDPESAAWVHTRLAGYEWQAGETQRALQMCDVALGFQKDYAPALLVRGRILLADGLPEKAVDLLSRAAELNPLPDYQWVLAEALRTAGRADDARQVESRLRQRGASADPRTLSVFLATRGEDAGTALRLAEEELKLRQDVFTLDAAAWSLRAAGRPQEALSLIKRALGHGTQDARLLLHAAVITAASGEESDAMRWLEKAHSVRQMLLPSERDHLRTLRASARNLNASL